MHYRAIDHLIDWTKAFDKFNLNGVIALFVLVPVAATVYSYRRYQDAMSVRSELARLSLHDSLTGLPNRLYLHDWLADSLEASRRSHTQVAVMFIDLDRFKLVNDTYGHEIGDDLMVAVAERLKEGLRPEDRIVRYGGDEFVVICPEIPSQPSVERLAGRLIESLERPFTIGTDTMRISTSIGITLADDPGADTDDLVREADVAMYTSKSGGSGRFTVFDPKAHGNVLAPLSAETRLRDALANQEFRLFYQPVVDVDTGMIAGVEALLRWLDPERGIVPPNEFIPILEDSGLIVPVGTWVLEEACRQARRWRDQFPEYPKFKVTVNVSARQLAQVDFPEVVTRALRETGVAHGQICLEITEGALMFDVSSAWAALRHAKSLGVLLALDDFGTGYSSLSYVRRFSLDMLKIDRSFVTGLGESPEDTAIVEHVIGMAKALGMITVAEGVEKASQVYELRRLGCDLAQGYVFSKPVPVAELDALLADTDRARTWATLAATAGPEDHRTDGAMLIDTRQARPAETSPVFGHPGPDSARTAFPALAEAAEPTPVPASLAPPPPASSFRHPAVVEPVPVEPIPVEPVPVPVAVVAEPVPVAAPTAPPAPPPAWTTVAPSAPTAAPALPKQREFRSADAEDAPLTSTGPV